MADLGFSRVSVVAKKTFYFNKIRSLIINIK